MTIYLSGIIDETLNISNEEIILNGNVQVSGNLNIGENVTINGRGFSLESFGNIEIKGNKIVLIKTKKYMISKYYIKVKLILIQHFQ